MPGKKKKYNARFPPARIKKIMQSDEDVGKVAAPVPVIISRALELFSETLLMRAKKVTSQRGARTLTPSHLKFCIQSEKRFDFLKDLVSSVPELQGDMDNDGVNSVTNPAELRHVPHVPGLGRGRGHVSSQAATRPVVPGTGKRRGRPPKALGAPPSARTKRILEKFIDDEYGCRDVVEVEDDDGDDNRVSGHGQQYNNAQDRLHHDMSLPSSPFYSPRSNSYNYTGAGPMTPNQTSPAPTFQMKLGGEQRTNSPSSPAPTYAPPAPTSSQNAFRVPGVNNQMSPKLNWSLSATKQNQSNAFLESTQGGGYSNGHSQTNGNFTVSPLASPSIQSNNHQPRLHSEVQQQPLQSLHSGLSSLSSLSSSSTQELDEDYDC